MALPVIIHKGGFGSVHQREGVIGGLVPLNVIYAVRSVVIAGDDNVANELFGAFIVEILPAFLVKQVPGGNKHKNKHTTGTCILCMKKRTYFRSSTIDEHYRRTVGSGP